MQKNNNKQQLLIEYLVSSPDTFALCKSIVKSSYFDPEYRHTIDFIHDYYDKYSTTPSPDQISSETELVLTKHKLTRDQIAYCSDEIEQFCRRKALRQVIISSAELINSDEGGKIEAMIKEALSVSLNRNLGLEYFADPLGRLEEQSKIPLRTPTKWRDFDSLLNGGLARKEILLLSANSGGGKSITLANLAMNFMMQGLNVMYISLELSESLIAQRFDTMFTGIPSVAWQQNYQDIASTLTHVADSMVQDQQGNTVPMGWLNIKHMPSGTNGNKIRAYIKEYELKIGQIADMLIVDYLDIMGSNEHVSADNVSEKDKRSTEQLRDIIFEYNMYGATASQQNRSAIDATEMNQSHIAGGLTKVNTVDIYASIILTPAMKAAGEIGFAFLKTRNSDGAGKTIWLRWDNNTLRIKNPIKQEKIDEDGVIEDRVALAKRPSVGMDALFQMSR